MRSPGSLFINLLGGFRVAGPHAKNVLLLDRKKTRAMLAVLALDPGRMVSRPRLTALLWPEQSEDIARHGLRQCLLDLRHTLAKGKVEAVRVEGDVIGLEPSKVVVDVARFERLAGQGNAAALKEAMGLYHGDLLEGFTVDEEPFEAWLHVEREQIRSRAVEALRKLLAEHVLEKVTDAAVQVAVRLLTFEPFDEAAHRTLMRLYAESGRRSTALRQYEACVELLSRGLGVEPEAETRDLYRRLVAERSMKTPARPQRRSTSHAGRAQGDYRSPAVTPLIGREADLAWLKALRQRSRGGGPQLALVVGEAGIGKSRLVGELASRAQRGSDEFLLGRGREGEDVLPFAPWIEALRPVLSEQLLGQLAPVTRLDLARLFPEIAEGPGPPPNGIEEGPRIFEAVALLLRLLATDHPLVVVIEDLHWCDAMTVRLLRFLSRRLEGHSVLLVGTARLEEMACSGSGTLLEALRYEESCVSRTLGPLSRDDATQLFRVHLPSRDNESASTLAGRMWTISEGNPFVVVQCARAVRERRAVDLHASLELPEQVRALTARCLAGLGDRAARLADIAAVIGRDFEVAVLRCAADLTEPEMADGVEELVRRRVLREVEGRFDFGHDRVREVAYGRLLGPRRALLHRRVALALETVYADDLGPHCAAVGAQYRHAGVWRAASAYQARAAFRAWERGAGREALVCFESALDSIAQLPDTEERRETQLRLRLAANVATLATQGDGLTLTDTEARGTPLSGGTLRVAVSGAPPTLDMQLGTATISIDIMHHVHEALFTFDRAFSPIPLLAEFHAILDGGIRHKLTLREGVRFHNGKSMTSADVVASLTRWGRLGSLGKVLWKDVTSIEAEDPYTVVLHLRRPSASLIFGLAEDRAAIYPKESVETAGDGELTEFIGTGPYRLVEHRQGQHIKLGRFTDYASRSEPPNGLGGRRTAYFDEIVFVPVPDPAARLAGVESGDYHFGELIQREQWDRILSLPQLRARIVKPHGSVTAVLNHARGPMTNKFLRQAFQAALDMEPILAACIGNRIFYRLDPGLFFPEQAWHSTAGMHLYNQHDKVKAQRLLKQAAYAGQSLRWLTTKDFDFMFKSAEVATHQLKTIGLAIDLQVVDWATLNSRAQNPELWDVASTAVILQPDPGSHLALRSSWWGAWCLEEKELLLRQLQEENDVDQRKRLVDRLQAVFYEDVGYVKMGDGFSLDVVRKELRGELRVGPRYCFWNSWLTT